MGNVRNLLSMFADDINLFIQNKESEWLEVHRILEQVNRLIGLTVNYNKTEVYRLGCHKSLAKFYSMRKLQWSEGKINVLGMWIVKDDQMLFKTNFRSNF